MYKMMAVPIMGAFVLLMAPSAQAQEAKQKAPKQEVDLTKIEAGVVRLKPEMDAVVAADAKPACAARKISAAPRAIWE